VGKAGLEMKITIKDGTLRQALYVNRKT